MVLLPNFIMNKIEIRNYVEMNLISSRLSYSVDMYTDKAITNEYYRVYVQNLWILYKYATSHACVIVHVHTCNYVE